MTTYGITTPRLWTPPLVPGKPGPCGCGCALTPETSLGFNAVEFSRDSLLIEPLPWQRFLLIHGLELRPDGRFRFRILLVLVARQNGKTSIVEVKNLWKMFVLGVPLVIGTAQNLDVAEESWDKAVELVEASEELRAEVKHVDKVNGKKALKLISGSRWKVAAANRKGGRGLAGDDVNLDELREHLNWQSWSAVSKTTKARPNAQIWAYSNAGDTRSVVLNDLQRTGRAVVADPTSDPSFGMFEWSGRDDLTCTCDRLPGTKHTAACDLQDRQQWAQANPSMGYTIGEETILSDLNTDPVEVFLTEDMCVRVQYLTTPKILTTVWEAAGDTGSVPGDKLAFALEVRGDASAASIAAVSRREDGRLHAEVIEYKPGTAWVTERLNELVERWRPVATVIDPSGPAGAFESALTNQTDGKFEINPDPDVPMPDGKHRLVLAGARAYAQACGAWADDVNNDRVRHIKQPILTEAVEKANTRKLADAWAWSRQSDADVAPLVAVTLARMGFVMYESALSDLQPVAFWV